MQSIGYKSRRTRTFERLENRCVLSASISGYVSPLLTVSPAATAGPSGYSPEQIWAAYGINQVAFNNWFFGVVPGTGAGQTIAIVDAYNDPNLLSDLAKFDAQFGLASPPGIKIVNQNGGTTLPQADAGWASEIALDVEWAHGMAPGAKILLVEANSNSFSDLNKALDYARNAAGVVAVSASWGGSEYSSESSNDVHFVTPTGHQGITFTVAAGDNGAPAEYPSSSPDVLSVGGSTLRVSSTGAWSSESAWSGGGGGSSFYEGLPSYQSGLGLSSRGTPDVTFNANPSTGFAVYDSYGSGGWAVYGGTSAGAPQWAALIAIADQGRALNGQSSLANAQSILYGLSRSDFHDVASGSNGYRAGSGYDLASGLGSPIANRLIPDLVAYNGSNSFTVASPPASSSRGGFTFFFTLPAVVLPDSSNMMSSFESGLINAAVPVAGNAEPQMAADTPANNLTMLTAVQSSNSIGIEATQHAPQLDSASSPSPSSLDDFFASLSNDL